MATESAEQKAPNLNQATINHLSQDMVTIANYAFQLSSVGRHDIRG